MPGRPLAPKPSPVASFRRTLADVRWAIVALAAAYHALVWSDLDGFARAFEPNCHDLFCDYFSQYYPWAVQVLWDRSPPQTLVYPPFAAVALAPLGALVPGAAAAVWALVQAIAFAILVVVPAATMEPLRSHRLLQYAYTALLATSVPVLNAIKWGQMGLPLMALSVVALGWRARGRLVIPAALLAAAVAMKLYPAVLLVVPLARRDYRLIAVFGLFLVVFGAVLPMAIFTPSGAIEMFLIAGKNVTGYAETYGGTVDSQYLPHLAWRIGYRGPPWIAMAAGFAIAAGTAALAWRTAERAPERWPSSMAMALGTIPFLLPSSWPHYFVHLPLMQVIALGEPALSRRARAFQLFAIVSSAALGSSFALTLTSWRTTAGYGFPFFSNLLVLVALSLGAWRPAAAHEPVGDAVAGA